MKDNEIKVKKLTPFDIIGYMFNNQEAFAQVSDKDLDRCFYIINDRFSINYPLQAQVFNHYKIKGASVVKCWNEFIKKFNFSGTPQWMFVKGKAKTAEVNKTANIVSKDSIKQYADANGYSIKEVEFALSLYPDYTKKDIDDYEKHLENLEKLKKDALKSYKAEKNTDEEPELEMDMDNQVPIF